jgi:DNA mismatch endonuclease (patch repair protein)
MEIEPPPTAQRSALMARVRGRDTRPELAVRRAAHAMGFRYRLHRRELPGSPDLVFKRLRTVIFVHGCFWHRHPGCSRTTTPKTRREFWQAKFAANVERDRLAVGALEAAGWRVVVIWECQALAEQLLRASLEQLAHQPSPHARNDMVTN